MYSILLSASAPSRRSPVLLTKGNKFNWKEPANASPPFRSQAGSHLKKGLGASSRSYRSSGHPEKKESFPKKEQRAEAGQPLPGHEDSLGRGGHFAGICSVWSNRTWKRGPEEEETRPNSLARVASGESFWTVALTTSVVGGRRDMCESVCRLSREGLGGRKPIKSKDLWGWGETLDWTAKGGGE